MEKIHNLLDALYRQGYEDRQLEKDYDPRGCEAWQKALDGIAPTGAPVEASSQAMQYELHALERCMESQRLLAEGIDKKNPDDPYASLMVAEDIELLEKLKARLTHAAEAAPAFPTDDEIRRFLVESEALLIADEEELLPLVRESIAAFSHRAQAVRAEPVATVQLPDPEGGFNEIGPWWDARDLENLRKLSPGTKLYTQPPAQELRNEKIAEHCHQAGCQMLCGGTAGALPEAVELVASEYDRQRNVEGFTQEHDDEHDDGQLAAAAACYATPTHLRPFPVRQSGQAPLIWPWEAKWWKPRPDNRVRELVKAGGLIVAEIERLLRKENSND